MPLLGHRVSQRSILWPLAAVLFPAWILLIWLLRQPEKDGHTRMAFRSQLEARLHLLPQQMKLLGGTKELLNEAEDAGLLTGSLALDAALAWDALEAPQEAQALLKGADLSMLKPEDIALARQTLQRGPLTAEQKKVVEDRLAARPSDWWANRIAQLGGIATPPLGPSPSAQQLLRRQSWARGLELLLLIPGILCLYPAGWMLWHHNWPRFVWSERIQALWSLPSVFFALGLRGLVTLALRWIIGFLLILTLSRLFATPEAAYHTHVALQLVFHSALAIALVFLVKEIVAGRVGKLHEVLGFDHLDFLDWRLWCIAFGLGVPMAFAVDPIASRLDALDLGGHALLDSLSRSPTGYNALGTVLFLIQIIVVAPFVEETIYRGFLLSALKNWGGPVLAVLLSSAIFAAVHALSAAGMAVVFLQALMFGFIRLRTRRLAAAMLAHGVVNVILYALDAVAAGPG